MNDFSPEFSSVKALSERLQEISQAIKDKENCQAVIIIAVRGNEIAAGNSTKGYQPKNLVGVLLSIANQYDQMIVEPGLNQVATELKVPSDG